MSESKGGQTLEVATEAADVSRAADGVVVLRFRMGARMEDQNTREVLRAHLEVAGGVARPTLADIRGVRAADRDARGVAAGPEARSVISRLALLVDAPVTRVVGNFFLRVTSPQFPTQLFSDEAAARGWLLEEPDRSA